MPRNTYLTLEPEEGDPLWNDINQMAEEAAKALSRLLRALHIFEEDPREVCSYNPVAGIRIDPKNHNDMDEVYLVPAQYYDASALMYVDHDTKTIRFVKIYEKLLPEEAASAQWVDIMTLAASRRATAKTNRATKDH